MDNKRRFPRKRQRMRVTVGVDKAFTVDVSLGGFCVESMNVKPVGTQITGTVIVGTKELPFSGWICWTRASDRRIGLLGRMGIRFTSTSPELTDLLILNAPKPSA